LKKTQRTSGNTIKIFAIGFLPTSVEDEVTHISQSITIPQFTPAPSSLIIKRKVIKTNEKRADNDFSFEIYSEQKPIQAAADGGRLKVKFPKEFHVSRKALFLFITERFLFESMQGPIRFLALFTVFFGK
jgi:hypothetical protein